MYTVTGSLKGNYIVIRNNDDPRQFKTVQEAQKHLDTLKNRYSQWQKTGPCFPQKN
jgi:hypothetical protein